jgi:hypothetical protein
MVAQRYAGGFYRGTNAERLALTPPAANWIFFETDTFGIYWWDGFNWYFMGRNESVV